MKDNDPFSDLIRSIEDNLQRSTGDWGDGDNNPPDGTPRPMTMPANPRRLLWFLLPFLVLISFNRIVSFYTDWIWYDSLELSSVFFTRIYASLGLFVAGALVFWLFFAANVVLARRLAPHALRGSPAEQILVYFGNRISPLVLIGGAVLAFFFGIAASGIWEEVLLYLNQIDFNKADPIFNRDVSFFIFSLPVWQAIKSWFFGVILFTILGTTVVSGLGWRGWDANRATLIHLATLGALMLGLVAWQYRLDAYQLVYSTRGAVFGAGYTDQVIQIPVYNMLSIITLLAAAVLLFVAITQRGWRTIIGVVAAWLIISILAGNVYPGFVQRFQVDPNELTLETPYIQHNIDFTRAAFDLNDVQVENYDSLQPLKLEDITGQPETITNVRLWDYRPLLSSYNKIQSLSQFYRFNDIDIDRYTIDGERRQVMLAARELVIGQLKPETRTWVNERLVYTHGYGVAVSPVAQIAPNGQPEFIVKDLPPVGDLKIDRPQIYFGESTDNYVIVNTEAAEFDYPGRTGSITTNFEAKTGILTSYMRRVLFALRFADVNLLLNSDIRGDSQLLWRRNITERVNEVAPFLEYDSDPYIVISDDGTLYWFLDAFTVSSRYPYSEPTAGGVNYVRNPVKVVINAYDGTMKFYLFEPDEPIAAAYTEIFPELFTDVSEMPADLRLHVRYPEDLFSVQADVYRTYHMTEPSDFYNKEDLWAWPLELLQGTSQRMEPYYVLMELPDSDDLDFIQILPFTPASKDNMVAWMATQNDPDKYGETIVYEFGRNSLIFGPQQIEANIDQDPEISAQLSLWDQGGSNVLRGNLLVIPVGESLIYVEPIYLQSSDESAIPALTRVVVATTDRVVMGENLGIALAKLFGPAIAENENLAEIFGDTTDLASLTAAPSQLTTSPSAALAPIASDATVEQLITGANQQYNRAQEFLQDGNWAGYGDEMAALQATLERLNTLVGEE